MSNTVKQKKKLTKRIALRVDHATWRYVLKQSRLLGITTSDYVRGILSTPPITTAQVDAAELLLS